MVHKLAPHLQHGNSQVSCASIPHTRSSACRTCGNWAEQNSPAAAAAEASVLLLASALACCRPKRGTEEPHRNDQRAGNVELAERRVELLLGSCW